MKSILIISLVVFSFSGYACFAQALVSLDSILTVVKERNPMLKNYTSRADAMRAYSQGAGSWMAPEAGGGLWMVPYKRVSDQRDKGQVMISVQQKFINPAKLNAGRNYQESKAALEEEGKSIVFNELRSAAKLAYVQWIIYERKKVILQQGLEIVKLMQKIAEARIPYNQSNLSQVYKAEARVQEIGNMLLMNDNQMVQKNIQLNQLMNIPVERRFQIDTSFHLAINGSLSDTISFADRRSDVRKIDKAIQSMLLNQEVERAQAKPDFNLSFNHMIARGTGMPNQFMLLGMISIPIAPWSSKGYQSNIQGMSKEIEAMKNERASLLNEALGATAGMKEDIITLNKQISNYEMRIIPALRKNYESVMSSYRENKEELPVVLDAWETLNMTQLQYLDTVLKLNETVVGYEREMEE